MLHVSYYVTYGNSLKTWIDSVETMEELREIFYGADIPLEYQSEVLKTYLRRLLPWPKRKGRNGEANI